MSGGAKRALAHSSIYAIGNIVRQLAGFIMLPIYTRHLTPADYGVVGLLTAALALIEVFFGARLAQAMPKFYFDESDAQRKNSVISTAFIVTATASLLTMIALIAFREHSAQLLFKSPKYSNIIGVFSVLILSQALEFYAMSFIRIQQRPWLFISISLTKLIFQLTLNIWLVVYQNMGISGVALSGALSSAAFATALSIYTLHQTGIVFCREQAIKMLKFNWPLWLGGLAGLYMGSANRYYINIFSSTSDVGLFELASKFSMILGLLVWNPFQQYWSTERFKIYHSANAPTVYNAAFLTISSLLTIGTLGVALFAEPVIRIMASKTFYNASAAVPFLTLAAMFSCLTDFCNFSFLAKERTLWLTRNNYLTAVIITALFLALVPKYGFVGAALSGSIAAAVQFLLVYYAGRRVYSMNISLAPLAVQVSGLVLILIVAGQLSRENLFQDIAIRVLLFLTGTAAVGLVIFRRPEIRTHIVTLLPKSAAKKFSSGSP